MADTEPTAPEPQEDDSTVLNLNDAELSDENTSSSSDSDDDDNNNNNNKQTSSKSTPTEWLATSREKRSTAGNRMKSMLANEEPADSDLELLFAEDEDDQGFTDAGDDASDVHMDSSSDDEDDNNKDAGGGGDDVDYEGEKELDRQIRQDKRAAAQRKRKSNTAIPAKFRKKVRIDPTTTVVTTKPAAPAAPRPKKKSERASWLPTPADMPTRASSRSTTRLSKEQLHQQMQEREARRLKQVAQMAKKAAKAELLRRPPLTQEERLREAEVVERRNAKSLNRWEEAERGREEERRRRLEALGERKLRGPVLSFWSGRGEDGGSGIVAVVEEKPKRKPRPKEKKIQEEQEIGEKNEVSGLKLAVSVMAMPPMPPPVVPSSSSPSAAPIQSTTATLSDTKPPVLAPPMGTDIQRLSPPIAIDVDKPAEVDNAIQPPAPESNEQSSESKQQDQQQQEEDYQQEQPKTTYTKNAIIYQNFLDHAIKDKTIQTQILFGRKMTKLAKPQPHPLCVITNHPARYRDPKTGLPYYNVAAYREIQRLCRGEHRWSALLGVWAGAAAGGEAAKGVPDGFLGKKKKKEEDDDVVVVEVCEKEDESMNE